MTTELDYSTIPVRDCERCPALVECRSKIINGTGNPHADIVFVGQNPGRQEDASGVPFVGRAGQVLATIIRAADIDYDRIWRTNAVRCWSPDNRKPKKDEREACRDFLLTELDIIRPKVIVALGETATHSLYGRTSLEAVRGQTLVQPELGIPLIVTYHPAFVLRGQWHAVPLILQHFEKARRIADGTQKMGKLGDYISVTTIPQLRELRDYLADTPLINLDTETTGIDWKDDELLMISFSTEPGEGFAVPILQKGQEEWWSDEDFPIMVQLIGEILGSGVPKALQNGAFDIRFLERKRVAFITARTAFGWLVNNLEHDTMLAHRLPTEYLPKSAKPNELPALLSMYTDMPPYEQEVRKQSKNKTHMDEVDNETNWSYGAADSDGVARLIDPLLAKLDADGDSRWVYKHISIPMVRACQEMSTRGIAVDRAWFDRLISYYDNLSLAIQMQMFSIAGQFNPASNKQVQQLLFKELNLPKSGRKTGSARECEDCQNKDVTCDVHDQVGVEALKDIKAQKDHPILDLLIENRQVTKLRGTYLTGSGKTALGFLPHIRDDDRVHAEFKAGPETGRLASSNPNMQNVPKNVEIEELNTKSAFRRTFIAGPGKLLMEADWSQLEVWVMAYELERLTGDRTVLEILLTGRDIHTVVARAIWPIDLELDEYEWAKLHDDLRRDAKVFVFGINYGLTVEGIVDRLHNTKPEAEALLNSYMTLVPGLPEYSSYVRNIVLGGDILTNRLGRRRHFPQVEIMRQLRAGFDIEELLREAVNFLIQSGGSDLHSIAHIATEEKLSDVFSIVAAIHDSCLAEVNASSLEHVMGVAWKVKSLWQELAINTVLVDGEPLNWSIPVEVKWGWNWAEMPYVLTAKGGVLYDGEPIEADRQNIVWSQFKLRQRALVPA